MLGDDSREGDVKARALFGAARTLSLSPETRQEKF